MVELRLEHKDVRGVFAIMPTPATSGASSVETEFSVDLEEAERGAKALAEDGVDAIMINGTFGEAATLTREEWESFSRTVVEAVNGRVPVLTGPTTLNTRTTIDRASYSAEVGADGMLLGRPMWAEMAPEAIAQFYRTIASEVPELGIIVYDNPGAFKGRISLETWEQLADIPQVVGAKYAGMDVGFRDLIETIGDQVRIMPMEPNWVTAYTWAPERAQACWSGGASCDPKPVIRLKKFLKTNDIDSAKELTQQINQTYSTFFPEGSRELFSKYNIPLEKARFNGSGYIEAGPTRPPYHIIPEKYEEGAKKAGQNWANLADSLE